MPENLQEEEGISLAIETYQKAIAQGHVREMIYTREKNLMDYESGLASARSKGLEEGLKQGIEQERANTEAERKHAEEEAKRAERLAQKLRGLGFEPEPD